MPFAGGCSAAIAAAYHQGRELDKDVAFKRVQWGLLEYAEDGVRHRGFSSREVETLEDDRLYAGIRQLTINRAERGSPRDSPCMGGIYRDRYPRRRINLSDEPRECGRKFFSPWTFFINSTLPWNHGIIF